ncbi:UNVERIFIED_CONTAM: hypothetical protein Sangu_2373000 [Sesamum angustifolium]|uniref:Uncharacterized protein n=1 Tax=Sesamum angustifolium TaxID=2727405 RepID=A0AAW2KWA1_9LAMI
MPRNLFAALDCFGFELEDFYDESATYVIPLYRVDHSHVSEEAAKFYERRSVDDPVVCANARVIRTSSRIGVSLVSDSRRRTADASMCRRSMGRQIALRVRKSCKAEGNDEFRYAVNDIREDCGSAHTGGGPYGARV